MILGVAGGQLGQDYFLEKVKVFFFPKKVGVIRSQPVQHGETISGFFPEMISSVYWVKSR